MSQWLHLAVGLASVLVVYWMFGCCSQCAPGTNLTEDILQSYDYIIGKSGLPMISFNKIL